MDGEKQTSESTNYGLPLRSVIENQENKIVNFLVRHFNFFTQTFHETEFVYKQRKALLYLLHGFDAPKKAIYKNIWLFYSFFIIKSGNINNNKRLQLLSKFAK